MKQIKIGIMGMGTVGSGVYRVIEQEGSYIEHKEGITLTVKSVLALNYSIPIPEEKKVSSIDELIADDEIDVIVEVMGGIEPAKTFITKALRAGKSVVSANKQLIANHWAELEEEAKNSGAGFFPYGRLQNPGGTNDSSLYPPPGSLHRLPCSSQRTRSGYRRCLRRHQHYRYLP